MTTENGKQGFSHLKAIVVGGGIGASIGIAIALIGRLDGTVVAGLALAGWLVGEIYGVAVAKFRAE